jgi:predicted nucleotide-binding protein
MSTSSKPRRSGRPRKPSKEKATPPVSTPLLCRPKIFLASSGKALQIAKRLKTRLDVIADVIPWWKGFAAGGTTLSTLLAHARTCDFAVVLFTPDDKLKKNGKESLAPRDNCIFELGLFMGSLGLEPKRSLLLRSDGNESLLSDLAGVTYIKLPPAKSIPSEKTRVINLALEQVKSNIKELGYCFHHPGPPILPKKRLMELESTEAGGNLLASEAVDVFVNTTQPIELNHELAVKVCQNMTADVGYSYFFQAEAASIRFFSSLVSSLAAACVDSEDVCGVNADGLRELMNDRQEDIKKILDRMQNQLRVYFLPNKPDLEFCVHNASHRNEAICYLRYSADTFVKWFQGEDAKYVADELRGKCFFPAENMVFQGSLGYELYSRANRDFLTQLVEKTIARFPNGLKDKAKEVCFGNYVKVCLGNSVN